MTGGSGGAVIVIPARMASTRLPEKPLLRRTGKFLVQHTWEQARRVRGASAVIVATDDVRVAEAVRSFGGEAVMTSPDCPSGTDRVAEAVRGRSEDVVVNVQGDEPEFDVPDVERLIEALRADPSLPLATLAVVATEDERERPSAVKVVIDLDGDALYFSRATIPFHRDAASTDAQADAQAAPVLRHVGIYAFRRESVEAFAGLAPTPLERAEKLEQLRALENGWRIRVLVGRRAPAGIDTPEDYESFVRRSQRASERL